MVISAYQVNNVLRVYGDQLRHSKLTSRPKNSSTPLPDRISISSQAKKNAIIDRVTSDIIERITQQGPHDHVEKEVLEKLENEYGKPLAVTKEDHSELLFKEIDENGETIHSLSIDDSRFLSHKLKEIIKEKVNENII